MSIEERVRQKQFPSPAAHAFVSVVVAAERLTQEAGDLCERHGITGDQYNVLRILRGVYPDAYSRGEIGGRLMRRSPDITRLLDRLGRQDLVTRERGDEDRRLSLARITPKGLALLERLDPEMELLMERMTAPLGPHELRELVRLCNALVP